MILIARREVVEKMEMAGCLVDSDSGDDDIGRADGAYDDARRRGIWYCCVGFDAAGGNVFGLSCDPKGTSELCGVDCSACMHGRGELALLGLSSFGRTGAAVRADFAGGRGCRRSIEPERARKVI